MNSTTVAEHIGMERDTLRLLCSVLLKPATRVELCRLLDSGSFFEPLQRVVFEEIRALGAAEPKLLLQLLPARVINRGFPDFDLEELLTPKLDSEEQIEQLFRSALRLLNVDDSTPESEADPA
jgi:hypothetical protein